MERPPSCAGVDDRAAEWSWVYWCRYKGSGKGTWSPTYIPACADHTKYTILFKSKDVEWAGPIPEPRPHEPVGEEEKNDV